MSRATKGKHRGDHGRPLDVALNDDARERPAIDAGESAASRESDQGYRAVVVVLSHRWRVIVCRDGLQWVLQRHDGQRHGRARWTGTRYFRTREALIAACRALCGCCEPAALARLALLPEMIA